VKLEIVITEYYITNMAERSRHCGYHSDGI